MTHPFRPARPAHLLLASAGVALAIAAAIAQEPTTRPAGDPPSTQPSTQPVDEPAEQPAERPMPQPEPQEPAPLEPEMQPEPAVPQPVVPQGEQPSPELLRLVEDFYHYAAVANYEAANAFGQQIIAGNFPPEQVMMAFREVHGRHNPRPEQLDAKLLTWQQTEAIGPITRQIVGVVNEGRAARATDPAFIAEQVERLSRGNQAYRNALDQLRNSGEYAVPVMIRYLLDPEKAQFHGDIRRAMVDLGVDMLNPLLTATQMENQHVLASLLLVLGDLGYSESVPYLLEQIETTQSEAVRRAAQQALGRISNAGNAGAAQAFYDLGERFYYGRSEIGPNRRLETATIWSWGGPQVGLVRTDVPPQIFDEIMAMRASGKALALGQGQDDALALWLASNYRREGELPEGETDKTLPDNSPDAHYYGAQAGTRYLLMVLARTDRDRRELSESNRYNAADVSLRAIKSLQEIVGRGNVAQGESPLTAMMNFPDRRVRIEAAFALAQTLPTEGFAGQEQVVPLLADALSQTGQPSVLVTMPDRDRLNAIVEQLRAAGLRAQGASSSADALTQAQAMPSVDMLIVDSALGDRDVDTLLAGAEANAKLSGAAKLILASSEASRYEAMRNANATLATTTAREGEALMAAMEQARTSVGGLPNDAQGATELALRSGNLLKLIGTSNSIFRLEAGQQFLLAGLDDPRPEIQMLAGEVVARLNSPAAQPALLEKALRADTQPEVKISLFDSLAQSAQLFGTRLDPGQTTGLLAAAADRANLEVQASAAEAVGAMNLPADQARQLIIQETQAVEGRNAQGRAGGQASGR